MLALLVPAVASAHPDPAFDPGTAAFSLRVQGLDIGYREFAIFALPDEELTLTVTTSTGDRFTARAQGGAIAAAGNGRWRWTAPAHPGLYPISITRSDGAAMRLQAFVMVPATAIRNGRLNGYRIGHYPAPARGGLAIYRAPRGLIEVTPQLAAAPVSPHFTLGEFLCKQAGGYPKYLVLRRRLLLKLEALTALLATRGVPRSAIHIMSAYRTPWYNRSIGDVLYSRHQWGGAADIYIDALPDAPGLPAALHRTYLDPRALGREVARLFANPEYVELRGGLGTYAATASHPPFLHLDARGFVARWSTFTTTMAAPTGSAHLSR